MMEEEKVNIKEIEMQVGKMMKGWLRGERKGQGKIVWKEREMIEKGEIEYKGFVKMVDYQDKQKGY